MNRFKNKAISLIETTYKVGGFISRYFLFVIEIVIWTFILYLIIPILGSLFNSIFQNKVPLTNSDFILLITAAFILAYTYETKKLREETVFQRKMTSACDIRIRMQYQPYKRDNRQEWDAFMTIETDEGVNTISRFSFLRAMPRTDIGYCKTFKERGDGTLLAYYMIPTDVERNDFLKALQLQGGEIKAWASATDGTQFIYTFRAVSDGWKKTLEGEPGLYDDFVLVKKELT